MLRKLALLASWIVFAQFATAEDAGEAVIEYKLVANWSVRVDTSLGFRCFAYATYGETTGLRFGAAADGDGYYFNVSDTMWRSLDPGEMYSVNVQFDDYEPWEAQATAVDWGAGLKGLWILVDSEFMSEFAKSDAVVVSYNDEEVAHLELTESGKALAVLIECEQAVEQVMADEGLDPFANAPSISDDPFSARSQFRDDPFLVTD
jgi:hypothetical protein